MLNRLSIYLTSKKERLYKTIIILLLALTSGILYTGYKAFDRNIPIANTNIRPMNDKSQVRQGKAILMDYSFIRVRPPCDFNVDRIVVDSSNKQFVLTSTYVKKKTVYELNDIEHVYIPIAIPIDMKVGSAVYYPKVQYYCNWAQKLLNTPVIVVSQPTIFYILPKL